MIKRAYSVSFLLSINIFVWQNVHYFLDALRIILYILITRLSKNKTAPIMCNLFFCHILKENSVREI